MRSALLALFSCGLLFAPPAAFAWSCGDEGKTVRQQVWRALQRADFVGEVEVASTAELVDVSEVSGKRWSRVDETEHDYIEIRSEPRLQAEINVLKVWKGDRGISALSTSTGAGSGGLLLKPGQRLLLYAHVDDATGQLRSDMCTRTALMETAQEDVALLDHFVTLDPLATAASTAPITPFKVSDLTGAWAAKSKGERLVILQFLDEGDVIWFVDEPDITSPEASGMRAKYTVRDGSPMWEIDIYGFDAVELRGITLQGIFQPINSRKLRFDALPASDGNRPSTFGPEAVELLKLDL